MKWKWNRTTTSESVDSKNGLAYRNRAAFAGVMMLSFLVLTFQNCSSSGGMNAANSSTSNTSTSVDASPTPAMGQDQINRKACSANFNNPTLAALNLTELTINSGLAMGSGDSDANSIAALNMLGTKSIVDSSVESNNSCATIAEFNLSCTIIADAAHPISLTNALDLTGASLITASMTTEQKKSVFMDALNMNSCDKVALMNGQNKAIKIPINRNMNQNRCVQGSFYLQIQARQNVNYSKMDYTKVSSPQYLKVTVNNGCWSETKLKLAGDANIEKMAQAGAAVAISGNWAAVLASQASLGSVTNVGAVMMYNRVASVWKYHSTIQPTDGQADDGMNSVAISGDTLVLGSAYRGNQGEALVYRFSGSTWTQTQRIPAPVAQNSQLFGYSLQFDGAHLAIGAPHFSNSGSDRAGQVYIYDFNGSSFGLKQTLTNTGSDSTYKGFGMSLALNGNTLVVGSPMAITKESNGKGEAKVFNYSLSGGWSLVKTIQPSADFTNKMGLRFGAAVAISANGKILISAPNHDVGTKLNAGAACLLDLATSATCAKFFPGNTDSGNFGTALAMDNTNILIGCPYCATRGGMVYSYKVANLSATYFALFNSNQTANDGFGWSVALANDQVVVGARIKNDPSQSSGAGFLYTLK